MGVKRVEGGGVKGVGVVGSRGWVVGSRGMGCMSHRIW